MKGKQPYWNEPHHATFHPARSACAGIRIKGWQTLPHSYTTLLRQNDNDSKVVQGLWLWASPKMMNCTTKQWFWKGEQRTKSCCRTWFDVPQNVP
jgi:hypothetical protein